MGITPHGVLISNAYTSKQECRKYPRRNMQFNYANYFKNPEDVPPREVCRNDAGMSLQDAVEHFLKKMADEEYVKKRTLSKTKHFNA